ncbi:hypothetical protein K402DRAFT_425155 [Aulographum hederae CBS 113979]|uniref:4Fe-4S ferredoxin-type domain-containing protein n=1 Tax=Aulographum hederae CBS 113979 TaxID=1176131 RepID=A0A6G1GLV5_9PEZI|nr:hypothetical protein K402DRAFT_425155 [Aulographum hederae CBS 113979]
MRFSIVLATLSATVVLANPATQLRDGTFRTSLTKRDCPGGDVNCDCYDDCTVVCDDGTCAGACLQTCVDCVDQTQDGTGSECPTCTGAYAQCYPNDYCTDCTGP